MKPFQDFTEVKVPVQQWKNTRLQANVLHSGIESKPVNFADLADIRMDASVLQQHFTVLPAPGEATFNYGDQTLGSRPLQEVTRKIKGEEKRKVF